MSDSNSRPLARGEGYNPETETYHVSFEWTNSDSASYAVIESLSAVSGVEPTSLTPLYETLDPTALDALFRPVSGETPRHHGSISFSHDGYDMTVLAHGEIAIGIPEEEKVGGEIEGGQKGGRGDRISAEEERYDV